MLLTSHALAHWLKNNGIEPRDVTLVLRTKTIVAEARLLAALAAEIRPLMTVDQPINCAKINGIDVVVTNLDTSARAPTK